MAMKPTKIVVVATVILANPDKSAKSILIASLTCATTKPSPAMVLDFSKLAEMKAHTVFATLVIPALTAELHH